MFRVGGDIVRAVIVFAVSSAIFLHFYSNLLDRDQASQSYYGSLSGEEVYYRIEQNSRCVGYLKVASFDQELLGLAISGNLRVDLNDRVARIELKGENFFNPLGQLVRTNYQIEESNSYLRFFTAGVEQIALTLSWQFGAQQVGRYNASFSGPVFFIQAGDGKFTLKTPWVFSPEYSDISRSFIARLGIGIREVSQSEAKCEGQEAESLHFGDTVSEFRRFYPKINSFLEAGGNG